MSADDAVIDPHQLLNCDDVAKLLQVSRKWVEDKVAGDEIPYTRIGPRLIRFSRADLDAIIAAGRHNPAALPGRRPLAQKAQVATARRRRAA